MVVDTEDLLGFQLNHEINPLTVVTIMATLIVPTAWIRDTTTLLLVKEDHVMHHPTLHTMVVVTRSTLAAFHHRHHHGELPPPPVLIMDTHLTNGDLLHLQPTKTTVVVHPEHHLVTV
jgi:hypothetical protein